MTAWIKTQIILCWMDDINSFKELTYEKEIVLAATVGEPGRREQTVMWGGSLNNLKFLKQNININLQSKHINYCVFI
jgi:hypothetical protein